uniref:Alginate lyase domain-containing protein n=1 Tax=Kwoniella bestiolae CBS 10118 TaxID=1296100 RepID=A0A1B9FU03_9TREE|nr:hypothetical protein I302_07894 [Kwoniella bestiolae CBS 10118]OCF22249.1 hypothetical protein I302_07894 [Kwoniella bestiolae CBS 10118]
MSAQTKTPLSTPKQPLEILLPFPRTSPNSHSLRLLGELVNEILSNEEVYSVTYSPVLCPVPKDEGGGRKQLFTIKPHWWQTTNGEWDAARPQGQAQLESLSKSVHILSMGLKYIPDIDTEVRQRSVEKIEKLLKVFFIDPDTRMEPQVRFSQCHPGQDPMRGNDMFVIAIRYLILVDQALLLSGDHIDRHLLTQVKEWMTEQVTWMESSEQGLKARQAEKPLWYNVIFASHRQYIDGDASSTTHASKAFTDWISNHPKSEDAFQESLRHDNRRHRCLFTLESIFLLASLATPTPEKQDVPDDSKKYLRDCVEYVQTVTKGPIEDPLEDDIRYLARVAWFDRILDSWDGKVQENEEEEPDGEGWENGWCKRMRMMWGFV